MDEVKKESKFVVYNLKYIEALSDEGKERLYAIEEELNKKFPHVQKNQYVCCNQDEPYADRIWDIILEGEQKKQLIGLKCGDCSHREPDLVHGDWCPLLENHVSMDQLCEVVNE